MSAKRKLTNLGNTIASAGGLCTILSLTILEDKNWKTGLAWLGVLLAIYGIYLIGKAGKLKN